MDRWHGRGNVQQNRGKPRNSKKGSKIPEAGVKGDAKKGGIKNLKVIIEIDDKDAELIFKELNIDMKKGIEGFIKKVIVGLVQIALLKKSGVKIDIEKAMKAGFKLGRDVVKKAREHEDAKN